MCRAEGEETRADPGAPGALVGQLIERIEQTNRLLDRLASAVEDTLVVLATLFATRGGTTLPDGDLALLGDGACPSCGSVKIRVPDGEDRRAIRVCSACGFSWRVVGDGTVVIREGGSRAE